MTGKCKFFWDIDVSAKSSSYQRKIHPKLFQYQGSATTKPAYSLYLLSRSFNFFYSQFFFNLDSSSEGEI
jgi:hypothetical protein